MDADGGFVIIPQEKAVSRPPGEEETDDEVEGQKENDPVPVNASDNLPAGRRSGKGKKGGAKDKGLSASHTRAGGRGKAKVSAKAPVKASGSAAASGRQEVGSRLEHP